MSETETDLTDPQLRRAAIDNARCVIVKVGTRVLTDASGNLDRRRIDCLAAGLCKIADSGRQTIMVSSGAVGAGVGKLSLSQRPRGIAKLQAVAAIGQTDLIRAYESGLAKGGRLAAQVLLTQNDLRDRSGYLHVRNVLNQIHDFGAIAVVNENDCVSVAELMTTFGDNDALAARLSGLLTDAILVILSDIDGLYDGSPELESSQTIQLVRKLDREVMGLADDQPSSHSKGGMASKLAAAQLATSYGHCVIIGPGRDDTVLEKVLDAQAVGTLFLPSQKILRGRRRWISGSAEIAGRLVIDTGAADALRHEGSSLLAIGIRDVIGDFQAGDVVTITDYEGTEVARGLCNYPSAELVRIKGMISDSIANILGHCPYDCVVHRDNLSLQRWHAAP